MADIVGRVLRVDGRDAAEQMAIDEALARSPQAGPVLRCYRWSRPAMSWGYFLNPAAQPEIAQRLATGWEGVRRPTGGGLVEHGHDLTYTLVLPSAGEARRFAMREAYAQASRLVLTALRSLGIDATAAASCAPHAPTACAMQPTNGDTLVDDVKVAGCAARRLRTAMFLQGYVALDRLWRWEVTWPRLADAMTIAAATIWPIAWRADVLRESEAAPANAFAQRRYRTDGWNHPTRELVLR